MVFWQAFPSLPSSSRAPRAQNPLSLPFQTQATFQKVWCEEMTEEQIMNSTLMSRTAIIGVRNIYDYPDTLLEMNDLFKRRL